MINFRYHVVSLVAVFLALAVGVVLGAGPLQRALHDRGGEGSSQTLAGAQADLATAQARTEEQTQFIKGVGEQILPGALSDKKVALVLLPGTTELQQAGLSAAFEQAGAQVVGAARLTDSWTDGQQREYRQTLAGPLSAHLSGAGGGALPDEVLSRALVEALTTSGSDRDLVADIISDDRSPLVEGDSLPSGPAEVLVLVGPADSADEPAAADDGQAAPQSEPAAEAADVYAALGAAVATAPGGGVAIGSAAEADSLISVLRGGEVAVSTVDEPLTEAGWINAVLAVVSAQIGAYGTADGAVPVAPLPGGQAADAGGEDS